MKFWIAAVAALLLSSTVEAQVTSIPQFNGAATEGFEGPPVSFTHCIPQRVFNNSGDLCAPAFCATVPSWSFTCTIYAHGGLRLFGSTGGIAVLTFDQPVYRFGGW